jgi:hypothetical protein
MEYCFACQALVLGDHWSYIQPDTAHKYCYICLNLTHAEREQIRVLHEIRIAIDSLNDTLRRQGVSQ